MDASRLIPKHGRGRPVPLDGEPVSIGRHPDNSIRLQDERVSRFHCILEADEEGRYSVRDLGSRNGTHINGVRIEHAELAPGDVLRVGRSEFIAESDQSPATPSKSADRASADGAASDVDTPWSRELRKLVEGLPEQPGTDPARPQIAILDAGGKPSSALEGRGEGPKAVTMLLALASRARATDLHIEPKGEAHHVRMRVDGQMVWVCELPSRVGDLATGLVRTACQLTTAGRDSVQDGHFSAVFPGKRRVEYRVSVTPSVQGPKLVMRVLDRHGIPRALDELGMASYMHDRIRQVCRQDHGLLLVCGPTGSGKTTTLYNALREIDRDAKNVITIEDPVEYHLEGVTQMPIDTSTGKTFGSMLRSVLRQDPDVILLGEIRDEETARTAMQAAMTGHVVFTTVHAKDTIASVFRLLDLGVEPYLVANSLDLILAQRLVRVLCENCKREVPVSPAQATRMGRFLGGKSHIHAAVGCTRCLGTGYFGRRAIFELLDFNDELRDVVLGEPTINAMKRVIESGLFTTLVQFGWRLVGEGATSLEEVDRVAGQG